MMINPCSKCGGSANVEQAGSVYLVKCSQCENTGSYASAPSWAIHAWNKYNPAKTTPIKVDTPTVKACPICGHVPDITDEAQISRWNNVVDNLS